MLTGSFVHRAPLTAAVRQALQGINNSVAADDLLFLEAWELQPSSHLSAALRASQIKRANPGLAEAIEAELKAVRKASAQAPGPAKASA